MSQIVFGWSIICALIVLPSILAIREHRHRYKYEGYYELMDEEKFPSILKNSDLFLNEAEINCVNPQKMHGRVDQVFKTPHDLLVIVDTKTRNQHRVYDRDIMQLSLYAMILRNGNYGHRVASQGYIRTVVTQKNNLKTVNYFLVNLYTDEQITAINEKNKEKEKENKDV